MTDLERLIYTRGLENLYGSVLLGDNPLDSIENLVYLTRELAGAEGSKHAISAERELIHAVCRVCWPELPILVEMDSPQMNAVQVNRATIAAAVCEEVRQLERQKRKPDRVLLYLDGDAVRFGVEEDGQRVACGEIRSND